MHILGKVLLGLMVFLLIPGAVVLTTMTLDIRSKWQAEVEQRQEKLAASKEQLNVAKVKVSELEGELQQLTFNWGEVWDAPQSQPLPAGNGVQLGVGQSRGLGRNADPANPPRVYAFAGTGEQSAYIGELELVQIDGDRSAGQLIRQPYPGEVQAWPVGAYHVRDTLPANWLSTVADLEGQTTIANSKLGLQQEQERLINSQMTASQELLDQRLAELNGDADAAAGASQQVLDGLVETLRKLENERNVVLDEVHGLRVKLVNDYETLERLVAGNRTILETQTSQLPATSSTVADNNSE